MFKQKEIISTLSNLDVGPMGGGGAIVIKYIDIQQFPLPRVPNVVVGFGGDEIKWT